MKKKLLNLILVVIIINLCGCALNNNSTEITKETIDENLQGTWEYFDGNINFGEKLIFKNGMISYTSYVFTTMDDNACSNVGTYEILEDSIELKINGGDTYLAYEYRNGELQLSRIIDSGADAGDKRIYVKK